MKRSTKFALATVAALGVAAVAVPVVAQQGQMQHDGMMGGAMMRSHTGTSDLSSNLTDVMASAMTHSGLTSANVNPLIQKLSSSNGQL